MRPRAGSSGAGPGGGAGGPRARGLALWVFVPVVLACCALVGFDAWRALDARAQVIAQDHALSTSLARVLSQHAHDTVESVDATVLAVREVAEARGSSQEGETAARLDRLMGLQIQALPMIHALLAFDAQGRKVAGFEPGPHGGMDVAGQAYFRHHRDDPDRGVLVGGMARSLADGTWIVTVSRRLDGPDGRFAGVVVGTIAVDSLQRFYSSLDIGEGGAIVLMASDGVLLATIPRNPEAIGTSAARGQFFSRILPRAPWGPAEFVSVIDGASRIGSYERVENYPLVVLVSHRRADVLAAWRASTLTHLMASGAAAVLLALLGGSLTLQARRRLAAEARLARQERYYRMLAENGSDLISQLDLDLVRTYVSPASRWMLGYEPDELVGQEQSRIVVEADRPGVAAAFAGLMAGGRPAPFSFRVRRKDGVVLWVEATGRMLEDGTGTLFAVRDISRRKAAEQELSEANARLERLVMLDGLTHVGNRRSFDTTLDMRLREAARSGLALSLLLIDIDHFKRLNDTWGHSAGDECLRLIAATLGGCLERAGDHLSRYGGEEFAVLLPETEHAGAMSLAWRMCDAVRGLDLSHVAGAMTGGARGAGPRTSVSIGVATLRPGQDGTEGRVLVDAADAALYASKQGGRDRAVWSDAGAWPPSAMAG